MGFYMKLSRILLILIAGTVFPLGSLFASDADSYPLLFTGFSGSGNDTGWLFKLDTTAGYRFNRHFEVVAGLPVYFFQKTGDLLDDGSESKAGIGNFYVDLRLMTERSGFYFSSGIRGTAPTGDQTEGFSSGRVTVEWNNYVEYNAGKWTPFGSVGISNSISDTHFFTPPFTSLGLVSQLEGGLLYYPTWMIGLGGSGYGIIPFGDQKIYSRLFNSQEMQSGAGGMDSDAARRRMRAFEESFYTVSDAEIAKDHGFSGWIDIYVLPEVVLEMGYSRSVSYEYNTLFFSARFDLAGMISGHLD
ncbi:MAG: hypothetical protein P8Z37_13520 [Acidobacteriota bacterium]